jgi:predicted SprT family Zn-dependent metalloprotease
MTTHDGPIPVTDLESWLPIWARLWRVPELTEHAHLLYASRVPPLGRSRAALGEIALNGPYLRVNPNAIELALCHHAAHLAVYLLHGPKAPPHGLEWRHLMRQAGYPSSDLCEAQAA